MDAAGGGADQRIRHAPAGGVVVPDVEQKMGVAFGGVDVGDDAVDGLGVTRHDGDRIAANDGHPDKALGEPCQAGVLVALGRIREVLAKDREGIGLLKAEDGLRMAANAPAPEAVAADEQIEEQPEVGKREDDGEPGEGGGGLAAARDDGGSCRAGSATRR